VKKTELVLFSARRLDAVKVKKKIVINLLLLKLDGADTLGWQLNDAVDSVRTGRRGRRRLRLVDVFASRLDDNVLIGRVA
jgi:hypothetical protein